MDSSLIQPCAFGLLAGLLAVALWHDLASYRIPNAVVFPGMAAALVLASLPGGIGAAPALGGLAVGLLALLPLWLARAAGAGDAKLMAMVGAFLGPRDAFAAVLLTYLAGMGLAAVVVLGRGVATRTLANLRLIAYGAFARLAAVEGPRFDPRTQTAARIPYSAAIALGTGAWAAWSFLA